MIDFSQFDLNGLYNLYESYLKLIQEQENSSKKEGLSEHEINSINSKISSFKHDLELLSSEISKKWDGKPNFSRENIFQLTFMNRNNAVFNFRPDSESYKNFGKCVVGKGKYTEEEQKELLRNINSKPPKITYGRVKIKTVAERLQNIEHNIPSLNSEQISMLNNEGIDLRDIFQIQQ